MCSSPSSGAGAVAEPRTNARLGTGVPPQRLDLGPLQRFGAGLAVTLIYVFLLAPILIVVAASFNPDQSNALPRNGLSLRWYREFAQSDGFTSAFKFSLQLGLVAAFAATVIGLVTAYGIVRFLGRRRALGQALALMPMMIPHILIGLSLLLLLTQVTLPEAGVLLIGHVMICLPFTIAGIIASLEGVDPQLELAAWTLGASRWRILWEVTIPLVAPGLVSSMLFAFIVSFGDVYISLFLSSPGKTTLPIEIFTYMLWDSSPVIAAITTVQMLMIIALGLAIERLVGLRKVMRL
ncbi:MAG: ABC transporter permease [Alphaproteobacteria bacterium]|nr:ABC transporter permease [Alphaproteobacteria bacterium]